MIKPNIVSITNFLISKLWLIMLLTIGFRYQIALVFCQQVHKLSYTKMLRLIVCMNPVIIISLKFTRST